MLCRFLELGQLFEASVLGHPNINAEPVGVFST
jgi:hypothetical protein